MVSSLTTTVFQRFRTSFKGFVELGGRGSVLMFDSQLDCAQDFVTFMDSCAPPIPSPRGRVPSVLRSEGRFFINSLMGLSLGVLEGSLTGRDMSPMLWDLHTNQCGEGNDLFDGTKSKIGGCIAINRFPWKKGCGDTIEKFTAMSRCWWWLFQFVDCKVVKEDLQMAECDAVLGFTQTLRVVTKGHKLFDDMFHPVFSLRKSLTLAFVEWEDYSFVFTEVFLPVVDARVVQIGLGVPEVSLMDLVVFHLCFFGNLDVVENGHFVFGRRLLMMTVCLMRDMPCSWIKAKILCSKMCKFFGVMKLAFSRFNELPLSRKMLNLLGVILLPITSKGEVICNGVLPSWEENFAEILIVLEQCCGTLVPKQRLFYVEEVLRTTSKFDGDSGNFVELISTDGVEIPKEYCYGLFTVCYVFSLDDAPIFVQSCMRKEGWRQLLTVVGIDRDVWIMFCAILWVMLSAMLWATKSIWPMLVYDGTSLDDGLLSDLNHMDLKNDGSMATVKDCLSWNVGSTTSVHASWSVLFGQKSVDSILFVAGSFTPNGQNVSGIARLAVACEVVEVTLLTILSAVCQCRVVDIWNLRRGAVYCYNVQVVITPEGIFNQLEVGSPSKEKLADEVLFGRPTLMLRRGVSVAPYHVRKRFAVGMHLRHYMVHLLLLITMGFVRHVPSLNFRLFKAPE